MTGRDLILFILENHLEDRPITDADGKLVALLTIEEAASKFEVGVATVVAWVGMDCIKHIFINGVCYVPANAKPIKEEKENA